MHGPVEVVPKDVLDLARKHLEGIRPPARWRWRPPKGRRVPSGWYFDYEAEPLKPRRRPGTGFGFAPGYLVEDDGSVRTVSWGELRQVHGLPPSE